MNSNVRGSGDDADVKKYTLPISLLSIDMKTKVVQHVPRIIFNVFKVFKFSGSQCLSGFQKFFRSMGQGNTGEQLRVFP